MSERVIEHRALCASPVAGPGRTPISAAEGHDSAWQAVPDARMEGRE